MENLANSAQGARPPGKRLALFFDGTWNEPPNHTTVRRLRLMLAERDSNGIPQRAFYDAGVGTRGYDRLSGGMFGARLSDNVRSGYRWLTENYDLGDEIYIFGFSRGAFTARSLVGLIARCGLLAPNSPISFAQLFERYQREDAVLPIYKLFNFKGQRAQLGFEERALLDTSYYFRYLITMVGVWDTVGSIGVPFANLKGISRRTLKFHNTRLSQAIERSYHAMAIEEYRRPYWVVLWTEFFPEIPEPEAAPARPDERYVEQRWFSGAHANVGGGYRSDLLPDRPLAWLQEKARARGLAFRSSGCVSDEDLTCSPTDSYGQFLWGLWRIVTFGHRFTRWIMADPVRKTARARGNGTSTDGWVQTVNERIDASVFWRCQADPKYRPRGLIEWARRKGLDLEQVIADPNRYANLSSPVTGPGIERLALPSQPAT